MPRLNKPLSWLVGLGLLIAVTAITAAVLSGVGSRLGWWHFRVGLQTAEWAVYGSALALALSALGIFRSRPAGTRSGLLLATLGALLALPPLVMALQWEYAARTYPAINDISTDTQDAPAFWDMPVPTNYPGSQTARLQHAAYPDLVPLKLALPDKQAFALALAEVKAQGWTIVTSAPDEGRIEATASSLLYGFTDEVIVRVKAVDGSTTVDVRSRSRLGRVDRGVNAKRIRAYLVALQKRAEKSG